MNVVLIIPTGIGAVIGGHAGDANPVAKLIGACCDTLITHPNVVNAADINEMPPNTLYVEGSMLDRFLEGSIGLRRVQSNRVLVAVNAPVRNETVNAVSAARATIGMDADIVVLKRELTLEARIENGRACGYVYGWEDLVDQVKDMRFDALAIASPIKVDPAVARKYLDHGGVNPWGGVEAILSKHVSYALNKPVAHAPMGNTLNDYNEIVDPRMAAELVSICYLHCVLKGLHRAPRAVVPAASSSGRCARSLGVLDVDVMVSPLGCWGRPHRACIKAGVPIMVVEENKTVHEICPTGAFVVKNYLEAAGWVMARRAGISPASVRRPLSQTKVIRADE